MDRLISEQAAIDLVRDVCNAILNECSCHYDSEVEDEVYDDIHEVDTILKCNKEIRKSLKDLPSAQPEQRWIPVSERLPEYGQNILAWVLDGRDGHMTVARFDDGKAYWSYMNRNYYPKGEIIAWMPLPEPYKERDVRGGDK